MVNRRFHLPGLFAVLLALTAQLGVGASVPRINPIAGVSVLCHTDASGHAPSHAPARMPDCPLCPLCGPLHMSLVTLVPAGASPVPPVVGIVLMTELPPPSTAPPAPHRPPSQPRAPPIFS
jgi:hypothetical protein